LARSDAVEYARHRAQQIVQRAIARLDLLPPTAPRHALAKLAQFAVTRQN
jgi:geranylgeranyl pyrophosphate synthase